MNNMKIIALVTLYNPDSALVERLSKLSPQVSEIVLLDNSPSSLSEKMLYEIKMLKTCVYHFFGKNLGLSAAFNWALKNLDEAKSSDFMIFFDQDSCVAENLVQKLVDDFLRISKKAKIGCLGPVYFDSTVKKYSGITERSEIVEENVYEVSEIITSSMITTYKILEGTGFWDESIFLDYADFELCWRMKKVGYRTFITKDCVLSHSLGTGFLEINFLFKKLTFNYSSPLREYYQTRAAIKLLKRNYIPKNWRRNFIFNLTFRIWIFLAYLPKKRIRLRNFLCGLFDGIKNKSGEK